MLKMVQFWKINGNRASRKCCMNIAYEAERVLKEPPALTKLVVTYGLCFSSHRFHFQICHLAGLKT